MLQGYVRCDEVNKCPEGFPYRCSPLCKHFQGYYYTDEKVNRNLLREIDESIVIENVRRYESLQEKAIIEATGIKEKYMFLEIKNE